MSPPQFRSTSKSLLRRGTPRRDTLARASRRGFPRGDGDARHVPSSREGAQAPASRQVGPLLREPSGRHPRRVSPAPTLVGRFPLARRQRAPPRGHDPRDARGPPLRAARRLQRRVRDVSLLPRRREPPPRQPRARDPHPHPSIDVSGPVDERREPRRHQRLRRRTSLRGRALRRAHRRVRQPRRGSHASRRAAPPRPATPPRRVRRRAERQPERPRRMVHGPRRVRAHHEDTHRTRGRPRRWLGQRHERCRDRVGARTGEFRKRRAESGDDHVRRVPLSRKSRDGEGRRERDVRRRERDVRLRDPHRLHLRLRVYLAVERRFASSSAHGRGARDDGRARTTSRGGGASPRAFAELARIVQRVRASTRSRGRRGDLRAPRRRLRARVHARGE